MKFCPICHLNFEDELIECPDCKQELLNGLFEENPAFFVDSNEELTLKLYNYLCEQELSSVQYYYDEENLSYTITVSSVEATSALQHILLEAEYGENSSFSELEKEALLRYFSDDVKELHPDEGGKTFINAREKYSDVMSSAVCLLVMSVLGFAFIAAVALKIIPFNFNMLFYIFSSIMFFIFLLIGISTLLNALKIKASISTEDSLSVQIKDYLCNEYTPLTSAEEDEETSPEELYFARADHMRRCISEHLPEADTLLIDAMIEEHYNTLYPDEKVAD